MDRFAAHSCRSCMSSKQSKKTRRLIAVVSFSLFFSGSAVAAQCLTLARLTARPGRFIHGWLLLQSECRLETIHEKKRPTLFVCHCMLLRVCTVNTSVCVWRKRLFLFALISSFLAVFILKKSSHHLHVTVLAVTEMSLNCYYFSLFAWCVAVTNHWWRKRTTRHHAVDVTARRRNEAFDLVRPTHDSLDARIIGACLAPRLALPGFISTPFHAAAKSFAEPRTDRSERGRGFRPRSRLPKRRRDPKTTRSRRWVTRRTFFRRCWSAHRGSRWTLWTFPRLFKLRPNVTRFNLTASFDFVRWNTRSGWLISSRMTNPCSGNSGLLTKEISWARRAIYGFGIELFGQSKRIRL